MRVSFFAISFCGQPANYAKLNDKVSRSAQPLAEDFVWLKEQGVTDIINFRTMYTPAIDFDEKAVVEALGMKYHNIPSVTIKPSEKKVKHFLKLTDKISKKGGKVHIHCKAGADRTGMYAFLFKMHKHIGTLEENIAEWIAMGHDTNRYPDLISWAKKFVKKFHL